MEFIRRIITIMINNDHMMQMDRYWFLTHSSSEFGSLFFIFFCQTLHALAIVLLHRHSRSCSVPILVHTSKCMPFAAIHEIMMLIMMHTAVCCSSHFTMVMLMMIMMF